MAPVALFTRSSSTEPVNDHHDDHVNINVNSKARSSGAVSSSVPVPASYFQRIKQRQRLQRLRLECKLFKSNYNWLWILCAIAYQYVHSVATNIVYYLHRPMNPMNINFNLDDEADEADVYAIANDLTDIDEAMPIRDLGFELIPALSEDRQFWSEIIVFLIVAIIIGFSINCVFIYPNSDRYFIVMLSRYATNLITCQTLRILSFLVTILPSPNYHCWEAAENYNPPSDMTEILQRFDLFKGCGDLIPSSHTIFVTLIALTIHQYSKCRCLKLITWMLVLVMGVLVVAARKHYTIDILVAYYTCPLIWFYINTKYPDVLPTDDDVVGDVVEETANNKSRHDRDRDDDNGDKADVDNCYAYASSTSAVHMSVSSSEEA